MKDFFKNLLSEDGIVSSKRFWGSLTFLSALILTYLTVLNSCEEISNNRVSLITSLYLFGSIVLGLGILDKFKSIKQ